MLSASPARFPWPRLSLVLAVASVVATSAPISFAQALNDPIPTKIPKGPARVKLEPVAAGLVAPVLLVPFPGQPGRLVVVDQAGKLLLIENGKLAEQPFLDITAQLVKLNTDFDERGLLGLAFDPGFLDEKSPGHRRIFTYSSEPANSPSDFPNPYLKEAKPNHHAVIASWKVDESGTKVEPASRNDILRVDEPQFNHNGGMVAFGPDGFLYISLGDGGAANDLGPGHNPTIGNGQDPNILLGKLLRIDVNGKDSANGKYGIPKDNPFVAGGGAKEIYALGLRNAYRFAFTGGQLLAADVGQNKLEYLYRVEKGGNYGWRLKEGSFKFNLNGTVEKATGMPPELQDPVLEYDHDEGTSIIGGHVYRGTALGDLKGKYIFGDYRDPKTPSGRLFYGDLASGEIREFENADGRPVLGMLVKGFGEDEKGEIYVLGSKNTGPIGDTGVVMRMVAP